MHFVSHIQFMRAGLAGALLQVAVATAAMAILLENARSVDGPQDAMPILRLTYLILAIGVSLTRNRLVDLTAAAIAAESRKMNRLDPAAGASALLICMRGAAILAAAMCLAPESVSRVRTSASLIDLPSVVWPAVASMGVAMFGANAQAASIAQDQAKQR